MGQPHRGSVSALIGRHPIATYYALVFGISWGGGLIVLGPDGVLGSKPISPAQLPFVYLAALAGPAVAGILSAGLVHGKAGLRDLRSRSLTWRVSVRWYGVALLTAPLLMTATVFALSLTSPVFVPAIVTTGDKIGLLASGIAVGSVVPVFEELGWTGFAIPQLRKRYGIPTTGLIVGLLWGAWHFPLFSGTAGSSAPIAPALYLAVLLFSWLPPYRVLMVWVYDNTKSVLVLMLMHMPIVVGQFVLIPASGSAASIVTYDLVFAAELWVLVAAVAVGGRLGVGRHRRQALPA